MEKDWLDSIKERMEDYEESVPEGLWDDISAAVSKSESKSEGSDSGSSKRKAGRVISPWVWRTAAVAAAVAAAIAIAVNIDTTQTNYNNNPDSAGDGMIASAPIPSSSVTKEDGQPAAEQSVEVISQPSGRKLVALSGSGSVPGRDVQEQSAAELLTLDEQRAMSSSEPGPFDSNSSATDVILSDNGSAVSENIASASKNDDDKAVTAGLEFPAIPESVTNHDGEDWSDRMSASSEQVRSAGPSSAGVEFSGAATNRKETSVFDPSMFFRGSAPSSVASTGGSEQTISYAAPVSRIPSVTNTTRHDRPIRVGLTARWKFSNVFGVESGLAWTQLGSTFSTSSGNTVSNDRQVLQYVGIPLNLTADIFSTKHFGLYLSGGGMGEKCVSGLVRTTLYVSDSKIDSETSKLKVQPLLWSVNAAAGVQYSFLGGFGLYAEPGLSYHFDDGSDVQTIYKDRPLDFVLAFGLRYSF